MSIRTARWSAAWRKLGVSALNLVFPPGCALCGTEVTNRRPGPRVCGGCERDICATGKTACSRCGAYGTVIDRRRGTCAECRHKKLHFDAVHSLGEYKGTLQTAVVQMKYEAGQPLAAALGTVMANRLDWDSPDGPPDLAICIPKYWAKRLLTGVNSAEVLMSALAVRAHLPAAPDALVCRRNINKQSMLSPDQRRKNVHHAWRVSGAYDLQDAHILLVDDIMTTGATASEAARALKHGGARRVTVSVVGRALSRGR